MSGLEGFLAAAAPYLTVGSAVVSAFGAIASGDQASQNADAQAAAANYNATVQRQQADQALAVANADEERQRRAGRAVLGQQRAAIAESGGGFGGSAFDIMSDSATAAELDALNIRYQGQLQSRGFRAQAGLSDYEAAMARSNARQARIGGYIGAGAALLSGAARYAGGSAGRVR